MPVKCNNKKCDAGHAGLFQLFSSFPECVCTWFEIARWWNNLGLLYCGYTATWNRASTVPAWLSTINSGSINMSKVCQQHAEQAMPCWPQLTFIKRAGMEPARLSTVSLASVNNIEPNPCCAKYWASTFQSQKCVTAISWPCSCIPCVFVPSWAFLLPTEEETINRHDELISCDAPPDIPPFKSKLKELGPLQ